MHKLTLTLVIVFGISVLATAMISDNEPESSLKKIGKKISSGQVFHAEMAHRFVDAFTQDTVYTHGQVWVGKNRYKVATGNQFITVDGTVSIVYNKDQNKVIISPYHPEDDDFAPSRFLGDGGAAFKISGETDHDEGIKAVNLEADDPFEVITNAVVKIRYADLIPVEISAVDQTENTYDTRFNNGRFIEFQESLFEIEWPSDAEIVDLRED